MTRIAVGYPSTDIVQTDFCMSLTGLVARKRAEQLVLINSRSSIITNVRNHIVQAAIDAQCDYLFFLDSDMSFPADALDRLLAHKKDICGCVYMRRLPPHDMIGKPLEHNPTKEYAGLVPMAALPTGVMLIRMDVFKKIPLPWFKLKFIEETNTTIGEDILFCEQAIAAGFEVWGDIELSHEIGHVGQKVYRYGNI